jgi:hypothetical protein
VQAKSAMKIYGTVDTKLISYHANEIKLNVKNIETDHILEEGKKRGYIGSGNSAHEKKAKKEGVPRSKRFKPKLK